VKHDRVRGKDTYQQQASDAHDQTTLMIRGLGIPSGDFVQYGRKRQGLMKNNNSHLAYEGDKKGLRLTSLRLL
jgi:hypothetical protein